MDSSFDVNLLPSKRLASTGLSSDGQKKLNLSSDSPPYSEQEKTDHKTPAELSNVVDYSNPFAVSHLLNGLDSGKFGSVTKEIESLIARKMQVLGPYFAKYPSLLDLLVKKAVKHDEETTTLKSQQVAGLTQKNVTDLEGKHIEKSAPPAPLSVVVVDSDEEDNKDQKSSLPFQKVVLPKQASPAMRMTESHPSIGSSEEKEDIKFETSFANKGGRGRDKEDIRFETSFDNKGDRGREKEDIKFETSFANKGNRGRDKGKHLADKDNTGRDKGKHLADKDNTGRDKGKQLADEDNTGRDKGKQLADKDNTGRDKGKQLADKDNTGRDKGVYVGVEEEEDDQVDTKDEELDDIWREMSMAIECSKDVSVNPEPDEEPERDEDCDHSFVLKDDLGDVCRVCGVINRGIETIFEFQYKVKKSTRTYVSDSRNAKEKDAFGIKIAEDDLLVTDISVHPRHAKQMKSHQVEGFNFLVRNLAGDHPGGCILAHAPGSGKTFMIISFMQSFLGKYPNARPLVVLPKGILSTWKKEFQTWQVEDIPLYDFYSVKADSRSQQLEVLKQWVEHKSILFLGYSQFARIICENGTSSSSTACQEILLKVPSILILDEGHNPRNDNTDIVHSLAKVQTPRKVVLSGTLFQNHVKEVFNILKLVRPKFMKMERSRLIIERIFSRVYMPSGKRDFCDLVEDTLQKDSDFKRKVAVIQDLREMTSQVLHYYKGDFLDELPGLVEFSVVLNLTPRQKHEADKLKKLSRKFKITSVGSAVYLHPKLKPLAENCKENSKIDNTKEVDDLIEKLDVKDGVKSKFFRNMLNLCESAGEKLLVFSQYLLPLKYLERITMKWKGWSVGKEIFVISGGSTPEGRELSMEKFNNSPDAKILFGSIKACGEGISLVGASRIIIVDVHLNPSVTRQAIGRAFRPGQKKKVFVYQLIAADSPEEEDYNASFKKELISKMWFEWNEYCGDRAFHVEAVPVKECGDLFLESPILGEDVKALYKR